MLYNPEWDKTPSSEGFSSFLDQQPADRQYDWMNCENCAIGKYAASLGLNYWNISEHLRDRFENIVAIPDPHNFGAAAQRAKALV